MAVAANGIGAWLKKWWLWIIIGFSAFAIFVFKWLSKPVEKGGILDRAHKGAERKWKEADKQLEDHNEKMQEQRDDLKEIKLIEDEDERLSQLADFANRDRKYRDRR